MLKNKKVLIGIVIFLLAIVVGIALYFTVGITKTYIISFDTDGGTSVESIEAKEKEKIKLPTDTKKEGYIFNGWKNENGEIVSNNYVVTKDTALKAAWISEKVETIKVSFDTDGGSKIDDILLEKGAELKMPKDPTKQGYTFKGWIDKNEAPVYDKVLLSEDTELKAVWKKEEKKETSKKESGKETSKKEYYCQEGYKLSGTKCSKTETVNAKSNSFCPTGTIENGSNCLKTSETKSMVIVCKPYDKYSTGAYVSAANGCFYGEKGPAGIDKYTCENHMNGKYHNGHCYEILKQGSSYYTTSCDKGYAKYTPNHSNPVCAKIEEKAVTYSCDKGYTLSNTKCTKIITVDAKIK